MKKFLYLCLLILVFSGLSTAYITEENVTVDLEDNSIDVNVIAEGMSSDSFSYITDYPVEQIETATVDGETLECDIQDLPPGSSISCPVGDRDDFEIEMVFYSSELVGQRENVSIFRYNHNIYRSTDFYLLEVKLPSGSSLADENLVNESIIEPSHGELKSDGSRHIVSWSQEPDGLPYYNFQTFFVEDNTNQSILVYVLAGILGGIGVVGTGLLGWRHYQKIEANNVFDELSDDEKGIIDKLRDSDGKMLQKDVVDQSDYSKAKISGIVSTLVDKNIIEKEKEGRSNKLVLKTKYR